MSHGDCCARSAAMAWITHVESSERELCRCSDSFGPRQVGCAQRELCDRLMNAKEARGFTAAFAANKSQALLQKGVGAISVPMVTICHSVGAEHGRAHMDLRSIVGAVLALAIAASPALACEGEEIFSDDFSEDSGMWPSGDWAKVEGGYLELKLPAGYQGVVPFQGGAPKDFDLCVDVTYPEAKQPDGGTIAGVGFWFKDLQSWYAVATSPIGAVGAFRVNNGKFALQSPFRKYQQIKGGVGAKNTFRVTVKGNTVTFYGNDQRLGGFRGVPVEGALGLFAASENDNSNAWKFSNFKLTDVQ